MGSGARNAASPPAGTTTRPSGLPYSEAIFATSRLDATPTDAVELELVADVRLDAPADCSPGPNRPPCRSRRGRPRRSRPAPTSGVKRRRIANTSLLTLAVLPAVDRHEDRLRAQRERLGAGHRRADPEGARLVAGGDHHAPAAGTAAHHHRLAAKRGIVALLDRREERVQIDVQDGPRPPTRGLNIVMMRRTSRQLACRAVAPLPEARVARTTPAVDGRLEPFRLSPRAGASRI